MLNNEIGVILHEVASDFVKLDLSNVQAEKKLIPLRN